jgi:hypothetical protein
MGGDEQVQGSWIPRCLMFSQLRGQGDGHYGLLLQGGLPGLQERVGYVGRGGHYSLPKYLQPAFLVLGLQPRPSGQALCCVHYSCLTQAGPGHSEWEAGGRSLAGPDWGMGMPVNSSCC